MRPVYAKNLIALLRFLGWEQKAIAQRLGVSNAAVSMWGTGKRPVPDRHWEDLWDLVMTELERDHAEEMAMLDALKVGINDAPREEQARRLAVVRASEARWEQIKSYLDAWDNELNITQGRCARAIQRALTTLGSSYASRDPMKLSREDRDRLKGACRELLVNLGHLETFECVDGRELSLFSSTPAEYLAQLRHWHFGEEE